MKKLVALLLVLGLFAAACGDSTDDTAETSATTATTATTTATEETMAAEEPVADADIVDTAVAAGDFETLVAATEAADLVETLKGEGPFTVFAPTDEAFAEALDALGLTAEELLADTDTLTSILTYHVVAGAVSAAQAIDLAGESVETVEGGSIEISVDGGSVMINDATVITPDIATSNGIIHVIDSVLLPPTG